MVSLRITLHAIIIQESFLCYQSQIAGHKFRRASFITVDGEFLVACQCFC